MSKSILVIDTPETCLNCRFCRESHEGIEACCELSDELDNKKLCIEVDYYQEKPDWCPLREFPRRKMLLALNGVSSAMEIRERGRQEGFNACIDELLEGGEAE